MRTLEVAKFSSFIEAAALILNDMNGLADLQGALLAVAGPGSSAWTVCSPGRQADEEFLSDIGSRAISWHGDQKRLSNPPGDNL